MKPRSGKALQAIYLLAVGCALFLLVAFPPPGEIAYLSVYGLFALWFLTLPWSAVLIIFAWALMHSAQHPVFLLCFGLCAALNTYLIGRIARLVSKQSQSR